MGLIYADIELINGEDLVLARHHHIGEEEVRHMPVKMLVDTGAYNLCINEDIQEIMKFPVMERRWGQTADGRRVECDVVDEVQVRFRNRQTTCRAMVLPGDAEPLLGTIPMEDMDVVIDTRREELHINPEHPDMPVMKIKSLFTHKPD